MSDIKTTFAQRLSYRMEELGFTRYKLAKMMGVKSVSICTYANGTHFPTVQHLVEMSNILNVSIDWLLGKSACKDLKGKTVNAIKPVISQETITEKSFQGKIPRCPECGHLLWHFSSVTKNWAWNMSDTCPNCECSLDWSEYKLRT